MTDRPINPDPEQQEADNTASRRQSRVGPAPSNTEEPTEADADGGSEDGEAQPGERSEPSR